MSTQVLNLPAGTAVVTRLPSDNCNIIVQPGAAGTVLIEYAQGLTVDGNSGYVSAPQGASTSPYSFNTRTYGVPLLGFIRLTAGTTAGIGLVSDLSQVSGPTGYDRRNLVMSGVAYAKQSSTSEQAWFSMRFPVGFLKPNFRLEWEAEATLTNGANVKTAKAYFGNSANTALEGGTVLWSNVYTSMAGARFGGAIIGNASAGTVYGSNPGLLSAGGMGSSTTANVTCTAAQATYSGPNAVEQALVLTVTTATTAADLFTLDAIKVDLIQ